MFELCISVVHVYSWGHCSFGEGNTGVIPTCDFKNGSNTILRRPDVLNYTQPPPVSLPSPAASTGLWDKAVGVA